MSPGDWPAARLLAPLAALYGAAVWARNRRLDRRGAAARAPVPVISVGNLTVGGTGKTPLVAWLARALLARGVQPAVVSRGYGGRSGRGPWIVGAAGGPPAVAGEFGDEPLLLARLLPGVPVVVGRDRTAGAAAAARAGAAVVILDDGFQHRRLARNLDLVLVDALRPLDRARLLPAGDLREPLGALSRADGVVLTRSRRAESVEALERLVRRHNRQAPILHADHRAVGFVDAAGQTVPAPERAVAFCGIGRPELFRADLERAGIGLERFETRRDHHVWSRAELARLSAWSRERAVPLVTTEKDLVRIAPASLAAMEPPLALRIEAEVLDPAALLALLDRLAVGGRTA